MELSTVCGSRGLAFLLEGQQDPGGRKDGHTHNTRVIFSMSFLLLNFLLSKDLVQTLQPTSTTFTITHLFFPCLLTHPHQQAAEMSIIDSLARC